MRNEPLTAYVLHARPFQEKRAIYYVLTAEHGVVHGIGKKGMPQFVSLSLFATGKNELKTFSQIQLADPSQSMPNLQGQARYTSLYVNEITLKLLPLEDSVPHIFQYYQATIKQLATLKTDVKSNFELNLNAQPTSDNQSSKIPVQSVNVDIETKSLLLLKILLRHYESHLFGELGLAIDWQFDSNGQAIDANIIYRYVIEEGWLPIVSKAEHLEQNYILGADIMTVQAIDWQTLLTSINSTIRLQYLIHLTKTTAVQSAIQAMSIVHRQVIDHLFDYKPLQSRLLWQQWQKYQRY